MENRVQLKTVKWIAVLGAVVGLVLLWAGVRLREIPTVQVGAIDLQYNMALARVEGTVLDISIDEIKDSFRITVDDGTGRISLNGYGKYVRFRDAMGEAFPRIGDTVAAVGNLSVSESWGITMFLASPRRLELVERKKLEMLTLGNIARKDIGRTGIFTARITDIRTFNSGRAVTVEDDSGTNELTVFDSERETLAPDEAAALESPGATIRFNGRVDAYRNKLQLRLVQPEIPENFEVVKPADASPPDAAPAGHVPADAPPEYGG